MKRVITSIEPVTNTFAMVELREAMEDLGVSEHVMLEHFFDYLTSAECIEVLKDLAVECDMEDKVRDYLSERVRAHLNM